VFHLKFDVLEVIPEPLPRQSFHILEYECEQARLRDGTDRFGKHVSIILTRLMLATKRKGLTWWSARD
jgi:hypothetical protein